MLTSHCKVVLPPSPVRDVTAFIFVLVALPLPITNVLLAMYFMIKAMPHWLRRVTTMLGFRSSRLTIDQSPFYWRIVGDSSSISPFGFPSSSFTGRSFFGLIVLVLLNALVVTSTYFWFSPNATNCIILFAKAIIASELVGLTSVNSTTVTSITSVNAIPQTLNNSNNTSNNTGISIGNNNFNNSNGNNNTNSINNLHSSPSFLIQDADRSEDSNSNNNNNPNNNNNNNNNSSSNGTNTTTTTTANSSGGHTVTTTTMTSPKMAISHKNSLRNSRFINSIVCFMLILNINYFLNHWNPDLLILDRFDMIYNNKNLWDLTGISYHEKVFLFNLQNVIYLSLCVNVIITNLLPMVMKYFSMENSRALDSLNSIVNNVPSIKRGGDTNGHLQRSAAVSLGLIPNSSVTSLVNSGLASSLLSPSNSFIGNSGILNLLGTNTSSTTEPAVINVEQNEELTQINLSNEIASSYVPSNFEEISDISIVGHNFEAFCETPASVKMPKVVALFENNNPIPPSTTPASSGLQSGNNIASGGINVSGGGSSSTSNTLAHPNPLVRRNRLRLSTVTSLSTSSSTAPNSTTIVNKKLITEYTVQPIWSFLAALKVILRAAHYFAGETTKWKNNGKSKFNNTWFSRSSYVSLSTVLIDDSKVIFKIIDQSKLERILQRGNKLRVLLNNVEWYHVKFYSVENESYICIYGLTPLFQYELDLYEVKCKESATEDTQNTFNQDNEQLVSHTIINTISSLLLAVLNLSPETLSLMTLQLSLTSTIEKLNQEKLKLKKHKKEEHRKIAEIKKEIEVLKGKITKYSGANNSNESRVSGKLKGLQHAVIQLEQENESLRHELSQSEEILNKKEPALEVEETSYVKKILELKREIESSESNLTGIKTQLKQLKTEVLHQISKTERLEAKKQLRIEENNKALSDIKNTKKVEMLQKSQKRNKRFQERYEVVLPKLSVATAEILNELKNLVGNE